MRELNKKEKLTKFHELCKKKHKRNITAKNFPVIYKFAEIFKSAKDTDDKSKDKEFMDYLRNNFNDLVTEAKSLHAMCKMGY